MSSELRDQFGIAAFTVLGNSGRLTDIIGASNHTKVMGVDQGQLKQFARDVWALADAIIAERGEDPVFRMPDVD